MRQQALILAATLASLALTQTCRADVPANGWNLHWQQCLPSYSGASQKTENKARYGNYGNHAADPLPAFILSLKEKGAPTKMQAAPLKAG